MRWLDSTTDSMDMNLSELQEIMKGREAWHAAVQCIEKSWTQLSNSRTIIEMFKIRQKEMKIDICYMELSTRHRCKPSLSECIAFLMPPTSDLPSTHYQHLYPLHHLTPQTTQSWMVSPYSSPSLNNPCQNPIPCIYLTLFIVGLFFLLTVTTLAQTFITFLLNYPKELLWWLSGKESTNQCRRHGFNPCVRKIPWRRKWQPMPVFLPRKSHGRGAWWAIVQGVEKSQT